jgi:medium-chain acyl-[acyl-carrier-protein] hydrolase
MGALLAFAVARARRRAGQSSPVMLIVSGHNAPAWPSPFPRVDTMSDLGLLQWLRRLGGTPAEVFQVPELVEVVLRTLRADLMVCESYEHRPDAPLDCPITAFGGLDDPYTSREGIDAWRGETTGHFTARLLPGSHFFVQSGEQELLGVVSRALLAP